MPQRTNLSLAPYLYRDATKKSAITVSGDNLTAGDIVMVTLPYYAEAGGGFVDYWTGTLQTNGVGTITPGGQTPAGRKIYMLELTYQGVGQQTQAGNNPPTVTFNQAMTDQRIASDAQYKPGAPPPAGGPGGPGGPAPGGHPPGSEGGDITLLVMNPQNSGDNGFAAQGGGGSDPDPSNP